MEWRGSIRLDVAVVSFVRTAAFELLKVQRAAIDGTRASARCCRAISDSRAVETGSVEIRENCHGYEAKEEIQPAHLSVTREIHRDKAKRNETTKWLGGRGLDPSRYHIRVFSRADNPTRARRIDFT